MREKLPDTPWHIGYTKKKAADPRRHKARCRFRSADICYCSKSSDYQCRCKGSAHCLYYQEDCEAEKYRDEEVLRIIVENHRAKTIEEEAEERAQKYKKKKISERIELEKIGEEALRKRYGRALECPVCSEDLRLTKNKKEKICPYCGLRVQTW